jgi:hypothetical protein
VKNPPKLRAAYPRKPCWKGPGDRTFVHIDGKECSFLKKRTKRLLSLRQRTDTGHGRIGGTSGKIKVFWFFSSEKNGFLPKRNTHPRA